LFGSVAVPLESAAARREGFAVWHECQDVDLAVWASALDDLQPLDTARNQGLELLAEQRQVGVAHRQLDIVLLEPDSERYLGHLCPYDECPKGQRECETPGCGKVRFLRQGVDFHLDRKAFASDRSIVLFQRRTGAAGSRRE